MNLLMTSFSVVASVVSVEVIAAATTQEAVAVLAALFSEFAAVAVVVV